MKLTCPSCGFSGDPEAYLAEAQWRDCVAAALSLPAPLGDRLLRYVRLFSPRSRALSPDRAARLFREIAEPISAAAVERNGRTWSAPLDYWSMALDDILARREQLTLPLKSHGYLFEIVAGYSAKVEGKAEAKREEQRRFSPSDRSTTGAPQPVTKFAPPPAAFKELVARMGRKELSSDDNQG